MKCPQGLWVQTLITAVFQPTYMLTSTNMNASIFWKEIVQFSQRMILISWLFFCITYLLPTYTLAVFFLKRLPEKESLISTCNVVNSRYHLFIARFLENIHLIEIV